MRVDAHAVRILPDAAVGQAGRFENRGGYHKRDGGSKQYDLRSHLILRIIRLAYFASGTPWVFLSVRTRTVFGRDATTAPSVTVAPPSPSILSLGSRVANATLTGFFAP